MGEYISCLNETISQWISTGRYAGVDWGGMWRRVRSPLIPFHPGQLYNEALRTNPNSSQIKIHRPEDGGTLLAGGMFLLVQPLTYPPGVTFSA